MHELGYTQDIIQTVTAAAERTNAREVRAVYLSIGEARDIVDELFIGCFKHFSRGTTAEHADLRIERIPLTVQCVDCQTDYPIDIHDDASLCCPGCGAQNYHLVSGMEFKIDRIEVA